MAMVLKKHFLAMSIYPLLRQARHYHGYLDYHHIRVILVCFTGGIYECIRLTVLHRFYFPDSPTNAHFLTPDERIMAVERIKSNQAGVENKMFKRDQCVICCLGYLVNGSCLHSQQDD
jgi:hypothetical protein